MKRIVTIAALVLLSSQLFAQIPQGGRNNAVAAPLPPPLAEREVSGIVKDATGQTVIGASVVLKSKKDTLRTATNDDGIFIFKNVQLSVFTVTVSSIGSENFVGKFQFSDVRRNIVLDPVTLKDKSNELNMVTINGTPSITYKTDTVEYRASDYKVRENATVDELLRHMEGMEVGSDGSLTHQGQAVTKARLNGKDYAGGDVAQAIQNLPADIVEKIQVVDDYGDQAARTGIKDGDPTKVLNITTLANKSIGNVMRATASDGTTDRYNEALFLQRINANQVISAIGSLTNSVNGVASTGNISSSGGAAALSNSNGGTGGTTQRGSGTLSYRDQLNKTTQINFSYRYQLSNVFSTNNSNSLKINQLGNTIVNTLDTTNSISHNNSFSHNITFDYEVQPDSQNYIRIEPNISYSSAPTNSTSITTERGFQNENITSHTVTTSTAPNISITPTYQYLWKKDHRQNLSITDAYSHSSSNSTKDVNESILFRNTNGGLVLDSLVNRRTNNYQSTSSNKLTVQYVQPLSKITAATQQLLEFAESYTYRKDNTSQTTDNINPSTNALSVVDSLSNIYNYKFSQGNFSADYRRNTAKYQLSLGLRAITTNLSGDNIAKNTTTNRNDFYIIPVFRFQYQWTRTEQISINYQGSANEPNFNELQPVPNYSNPQNPVFGNPDLKPSFSHTITTRYNDYIANSKFTFGLNTRTTFYQDQIVTNNVTVVQPIIVAGKTSQNVINETYYLNTNGAFGEQVTYNIAKQLNDRAYNLEFNGGINYGYNLAYNGGTRYHVTSWETNERFGPRINPNLSIEVNPYVSFDDTRSFNSIPSSFNVSNDTKTTSLALEGKFYLLDQRRFTFEYNLTKSYYGGTVIPGQKNPFVVNSYIDYEFFARKNGILRISAFDIFDQNQFINHSVSTTGYTNTISNSLSRYFLVSFIFNLQKFSGTPQRGGRDMQRRGDGSFIYN